jgi:putative phage-type endonuclease
MKLTIENTEHWHVIRSKNIGGSEVSALFGRSPYTTKWQLWMDKSGKLQRPFDEKYTRAGKFFEAGIAAWAAEKWGMTIHKVEEYYTDDSTPGMGATLDYATDEGVPVEIKYNHYKSADWGYEEDVLTLVPESYIWQCQHQMACYGGDYAWLVAFIAGEPRRMKVKRSERIIESVRSSVSDFWASIAEERVPPVDYKTDGDALADLMMISKFASAELDAEDYEEVICLYRDAKATEKLAKEKIEEYRAMLLDAAEKAMHGINDRGPKAKLKCGRFVISLSEVAENPGRLVTAEMVGTHVGGRKGHFKMTLKEEPQ